LIREGLTAADAARSVHITYGMALYYARREGVKLERRKCSKVLSFGTKKAKKVHVPFSPPPPDSDSGFTMADASRAASFVRTLELRGQTGHTFSGDDWWVVQMIPRMAEELLKRGFK